MIQDIINEITAKKQIPTVELYRQLVNERLSTSLQSYYHDLDLSYEELSSIDNVSIHKLNKLIKS